MNKLSADISVVIPAYNAEKYLRETLISVFSQTLSPLEVIVVNDGSKDLTSEIAKEFPVVLIEQENLGPAIARNLGVLKSKGTWIAFIDADDIWELDKLEKVVTVILNNKDIDIIATNMMVGNPENGWKPLDLSSRFNNMKPFFPQLYRRSFLATSTLVVKKELIIKEGCFDPSYFGPEDFDLWLKIALSGGRLYFIKSYLTKYRVHGNSITSDPSRTYRDTQLILQKHKKSVSLNLYVTRFIVLHIVIARIFFKQRKFKNTLLVMRKALADIIFRPIEYFL